MENGVYVLCRDIDSGPAAHQFVVLVPEMSNTLPGIAHAVNGIRCVVMGAYNISGFLRARLFAESDTAFLSKFISNGNGSGVQIDKVELQACLAVPEDQFLSHIYQAYLRYRSHEGGGGEISYPVGDGIMATIFRQLNPSNYNSNSWAQSLIFWSCMAFLPGKVISDFRGLDVGNERIIPKTYFL